MLNYSITFFALIVQREPTGAYLAGSDAAFESHASFHWTKITHYYVVVVSGEMTHITMSDFTDHAKTEQRHGCTSGQEWCVCVRERETRR